MQKIVMNELLMMMKYCCYIKGTKRDKYVINEVKGCFKMKKKC